MIIPTYFSHSYRLNDQDLNKELWRLFADANFSFFVDPPSDTTIHTHLERMMRRCSAFVAVVNRREDVGRFHCSRFILYEYDLAIQARRPRLLLIDRSVPDLPFRSLSQDEIYLFSRNDALSGHSELREKIAHLHRKAETFQNRSNRQRGPIALIVPPDRERSSYASRRVAARIKKAAAPAGFEIVECPVPYEHNALFALDLDRYEAVILDVRGTELPPWVFAYVYGRLIPTIKLVRVLPNETPEALELPPLVRGLRMDEDEPGVESVTYWQDEDDLIWLLTNAFLKLDEEETVFKKNEEGELYFESISRRPARVFISNAGNANPLARQFSEQLRRRNIERFHYKDLGAIQTGALWADKIEQEVTHCDVFIALIGLGYDTSEWCKKELQIALERKDDPLLMLFLADQVSLQPLTGEKKLARLKQVHVPDLPVGNDAAIAYLLGELRKRLTRNDQGQNVAPHRTTMLGASREVVIDAIRHVSRSAWPRLVALVQKADARAHLPVDDTAPIRPRSVAEQLFVAAQRADVGQSGEILRSLVTALASLSAPRRKAALQQVAHRVAVER